MVFVDIIVNSEWSGGIIDDGCPEQNVIQSIHPVQLRNKGRSVEYIQSQMNLINSVVVVVASREQGFWENVWQFIPRQRFFFF